MALSLALLLNADQPYLANALAVAYLTLAFLIHGFWLEGRRLAVGLELLRLATLAVLAQLPLYYQPIFSPALQLFALTSAAGLILASSHLVANRSHVALTTENELGS